MQKRVQITTQLPGFSHTKCTFAIGTQIKKHGIPSAPEVLPWLSSRGATILTAIYNLH